MASSLSSLLGAAGVVLSLSLVFLITGRVLLRWAFKESERLPPSLLSSMGFFLGSAQFLVLWRIGEGISHSARIGMWAAFALTALATLYSLRREWKTLWEADLPLRTRMKAVAIAVAVPLALSLYWMQGDNPIRNWDHIGSAHSPRYANISIHVVDTNRIPIFGQDYEQSLLAAVPIYFGFNHPLWGLYLWLSVSILFLMLGTYGLFRQLKFSSDRSMGYMLLTLGSNVTLSLFLVQAFDNGFPLAFTGKTDLVRSAGSFFVFVFWVVALFHTQEYKPVRTSVIGLLLTVSWALSGIQNIAIAGGILMILLAYSVAKKPKCTVALAAALFSIVLPALLVSQKGGMLTAGARRDAETPPGVINYVTVPGKKELLVNPTIPYSAFGQYWAYFSPKAIPFTWGSLKKVGDLQEYAKLVFALEMNLWTSIKTLFFPLLGILSLGLWLLSGRGAGGEMSWTRMLWITGALSFLVGLPIVSLFEVSWWRWGLTRFMIPGYTLGTLCLILFWDAWTRTLTKHSRVAWIVLSLLLLTGPVVGLSLKVRENTRAWNQYTRCLAFLVSEGKYVE